MAIMNSRRVGDRREGRQLRSLPVLSRLSPYITRRNSAAGCFYADTMEVTDIEQWILAKRAEGYKNLGLLHLVAAAYVRTVAARPGINRFVAGRRVFARNDIQLVLMVKRGSSPEAAQVPVKVSFGYTDTVFDVYRRLNDAIDEVHSSAGETPVEKLAGTLSRLPRFLQRWCLGVLRLLDYFDALPASLLENSPLHASLGVVDMGSLGVQPVNPPLSDFGNMPCLLSFGAKRRCYEPDSEGAVRERRYVDYRFTCDERIADASYYAGALKNFKYLLRNPLLLELPPERVEDDVN